MKKIKYKISHYGIRGNTLSTIADFLSDRTQHVIIDGCKSQSAPVESGVSQGSVLGSLLFLLIINDLPEYVSSDCTTRLFADDCVLYRSISPVTDAIKLQADLNGLNNLEADWLMQFHPSK